jgi:hypothetical protein
VPALGEVIKNAAKFRWAECSVEGLCSKNPGILRHSDGPRGAHFLREGGQQAGISQEAIEIPSPDAPTPELATHHTALSAFLIQWNSLWVASLGEDPHA